MIRTLLVLLPLVALPVVPQVSRHKDTDRVELQSGKELKGRVVHQDDEVVLLRQGKRKPREIPRDEVKSVSSLEQSLAEFIERYDAVDKQDAEALGDLARFAESRGLTGEAAVTWVAAIFADPSYRPAYEALDARESKTKGWQFKIGKRWKTLEDAKAIEGSWKERWEIETTHFVLRTDLPVERLPSIVVNIERFFLDYYALMRRALKLWVFDEVPKINLYVEDGKMPRPPVPTDAWYDRIRNELDVRVRREPDLSLIMSEMSRLMLFSSLRGTIGQTGTTPPWVGRGLADLFGVAVVQQPDKAVSFDFTREAQQLFQTHAAAAEPLSMDRILTMSPPEFIDGTNHELARAQAYTLVHFMVFADEGKYLPGFGDYLQAAFGGQGSKTHLLKALDLRKSDALEEEWASYVRAKAGR